jgi:hypothetical protein
MVDTFDILEIADCSCTCWVAKKHPLSAKFGMHMLSSFIIRKPHKCVFWVEISHEWFSWPGGRVDFPGQENHKCYISTQKTHKCRFLFITWMTLMRASRDIFSSNRRKFNSEIQDPKVRPWRCKWRDVVTMMLRRWEQWRNNVTMTLRRQERWCHLGPLLGARQYAWRHWGLTTSLWQCTGCITWLAMLIQPCDPEKYHTVGLHAWQRQQFGRNVWIKLFSRVWNRFQWCSTDRSPNYLGF